jgi:hypothetical protein
LTRLGRSVSIVTQRHVMLFLGLKLGDEHLQKSGKTFHVSQD